MSLRPGPAGAPRTVTRRAAITGSLLAAFGFGVFLWKSLALGVPLLPARAEGLWQVEFDLSARGRGRGSLRVAAPRTGPGQLVFDEHLGGDRLAVREEMARGDRFLVVSGRFDEPRRFLFGFRVELSEVAVPLRSGPAQPVPRELAPQLRETATIPTGAAPIREVLDSLPGSPEDDAASRLRAIYAFVGDEVATSPVGSDDALLALADREGSDLGVERLLVAMLRTAGIPARLVRGIWLRDDGYPREAVWAEAYLDGEWVPISASSSLFARKPRELLALRRSDGALVEAVGLEATAWRIYALRERLRPEELTAMMVPGNPVLSRLSLYRLPLPTQSTLRLLLLTPLAALVVTVFRNLVGVPTFGTFLPMLLALALRTSTLAGGLALLGSVLAIGFAGRLVLDRLRLLMVPRLSVLLCVVVLTITGLALVGRDADSRDFSAGVLLPIVILTMLIERFSIALAEEGPRSALVQFGWSVAVALCAWPIFRSPLLEHLFFGFPELVFCVMGLLVLVGGYTGYRVADLIRFRSLLGPAGEMAS